MFLEAAKTGKIVGFLKEHGCEATEEEIKAFLEGKKSTELSDEELDNVAGGSCSEGAQLETMVSVFTFGTGCVAMLACSLVSDAVGAEEGGMEGRLCSYE